MYDGSQAPMDKRVLFVCALLALAVVLVFGQTGRHDFVNFDDEGYVYNDEHVKSGLKLREVVFFLVHRHAYTYHPLTTWSHMLDCQLFGLDAGKHHWMNVILHAATSVGLFLALLQMTGRLWPAALVAAVFASHPLRVESVAWIAERKDVLSGLFFVLTLWAYARYVRRPNLLGRYMAVCLFYALGLLAKPMLVTLPLVLLLLDYWPLARGEPPRRLLAEKLPLFLLALIASGITLHTQGHGGAVQSLETVSWAARIANTPIAYVNYLGCFFWPRNLAVLYPHPLNGYAVWEAVAKACILVAISTAAICLWRRRPYLLVGWLWYLIMLLPVIGLLQVGGQSMADRYTYLPQIGFTLAVVWSLAELGIAPALNIVRPTRSVSEAVLANASGWSEPQSRLRNKASTLRPARAVFSVASIGLLAALIVAAWGQTTHWRDSVALWTRDAMYSNATQLYDFGLALHDKGRHSEAIEQYQAALRIDSGDVAVLNALGLSYEALGQMDSARQQYRAVLAIDSASTDGRDNLARLQRLADTATKKGSELFPLAARNGLQRASAGVPKTKDSERAAVNQAPASRNAEEKTLDSASLSAPSTRLASRPNYLANPGFEQGLKPWTADSFPNGEVALDDAVSHSGKCSLRLKYRKDADAHLSTYLYSANSLPAVLKPGCVYTFSGWIKIAGVPPGKSGPVAYLCEAHARGGHSRFVSGNTDPTKDNGWVFVSFPYTPLQEDTAHQFRCQCHAPPDGMVGEIWFDDLKLEEGGAPTAFRPDWIDAGELYSHEPQIPWFPLPAEFRSSLDIVTPHAELARPYAGGAPRVLWVGFWNNARVGCELAERGELVLDTVAMNASSIDVSGVKILHEKCVEVFRQRLGVAPAVTSDHGPQVLLIEQGVLELLSGQDRAAIADRVAQGMGCVVLLGPIRVSNHPGAVVTLKIQELLDAAAKLPQAGRSRVLTRMNVGQHPLWGRGTLGIETVYSEILQGIYRSLGKQPAEAHASVQPRQPVANQPWRAAVFGQAASVRFRIIPDLPAPESSLMDGYGASIPRTVLAETEVKADAAAAGTVRCAMPALPCGNYMLLAQLLDERKQVLGWSLAPFTVLSSVEIAKLDAHGAEFAPREPLRVSCTIKNSYHPLPHARLVTQLVDPRGRLMSRSDVPLALSKGETNQDLVLELSHAEHCSVRLQVAVLADNVVQAERSLWLNSERLMPRVDFHIGPYDDYTQGWCALGADMTLGAPRPELALRPCAWIDLLSAVGPDAACCDARTLDKATKFTTSALTATAPWTPIGCMLHDEVNNFGFHWPPQPEELRFFRRYLREIYKELSTLNTSWNTKYSSWYDIDDEPTKIRFATQGDRNPAPWADWHAASEQAAHRFYAALSDGVRRDTPAARIGPSGTRDGNGVNGMDWWLLAQDFRCVCLYEGLHNELYRSFAPEGRLMMNWSHFCDARDDPDSLRVRLWQDLFAQCGGTPVYGGRYSNVFLPDYRPKIGALALATELAAVRDGFGRLILNARRNDAAAAIFYSPACYRARIVAMKDDGHVTAAAWQNNLLASVSAALADLRIGAHFVSYEQVARGQLDPRTTKALFLWGSLALSDAEAAAVRQYLADGGTVIADSEPGLYDEHCHRRALGALHDCLPQGSAFRQVGKGTFILYPDFGSEYVKARGYHYEGTADPTASLELPQAAVKLRTMLAEQAGLQANFRLQDDRGRDFGPAMTAMDYVDGKARYVACINKGSYGHSLPARLSIPTAGHLYNCRTGEYLGTAAERAVELRESTGNLYALLPYRVQRLELAAPTQANLGLPIDVKGSLVADGGPFARHFVVLQLRRPDGRDLPEHRWILESENGHFAGQLFLALNDPLGKWTLIARDVATGVSQTAAIEVAPALTSGEH